MSSATWTSSAVSSNLEPYERDLFRFIDSDGYIATLNLVDNQDEAEQLEAILYNSRNEPFPQREKIHRVLAYPFENRSPNNLSRFRGGYEPGVLYAAETYKTAALERGYHKVRFIRDSESLQGELTHSQKLINFKVKTDSIDVRIKPFAKDQKIFSNPLLT